MFYFFDAETKRLIGFSPNKTAPISANPFITVEHDYLSPEYIYLLNESVYPFKKIQEKVGTEERVITDESGEQQTVTVDIYETREVPDYDADPVGVTLLVETEE